MLVEKHVSSNELLVLDRAHSQRTALCLPTISMIRLLKTEIIELSVRYRFFATELLRLQCHIQTIRGQGHLTGQAINGLGIRSRVEAIMDRFKSGIDNRLRTRAVDNQNVEIVLACDTLKRMRKLRSSRFIADGANAKVNVAGTLESHMHWAMLDHNPGHLQFELNQDRLAQS